MTLPVLTFGGAGMFRMGVRSIALRTASIDLLLGLSTLGTVALSIANLVRGEPHVYFDAAAMLVTLRLAGQLIETRVRANADRKSVVEGKRVSVRVDLGGRRRLK